MSSNKQNKRLPSSFGVPFAERVRQIDEKHEAIRQTLRRRLIVRLPPRQIGLRHLDNTLQTRSGTLTIREDDAEPVVENMW